jgi:hypothetical protein
VVNIVSAFERLCVRDRREREQHPQRRERDTEQMACPLGPALNWPLWEASITTAEAIEPYYRASNGPGEREVGDVSRVRHGSL